MINKIEKLLDLCIEIAERKLNEPTSQLPLPFPAAGSDGPDCETQTMTPNPPAEKKTRKPRAPKTAAEDSQLAGANAAADAEIALEDQLGVGPVFGKGPLQMTEEESKTKMEEVTKQFVSLCKNDTPEDGKTRAIKLMRETFKVAKLGELTHPQRMAWIAEMEKGILEHK